jgi:hypothetical protein
MNEQGRGESNTRSRSCLIAAGIGIVLLIGLLTTFHFVIMRAKRRAQLTSCLSNLKQIGTAINLYMTDWDDRFPLVSGFGPELDKHEALWGVPGDMLNPRGGESAYMPELLGPYMRKDWILVCPSIGSHGAWTVPDGKIEFGKNGTTYTFNAWCIRSRRSKPPAACIRISGMRGSICKRKRLAPIVWDSLSGYACPAEADYAQFAHDDCINVLLVDGHTRCVALPPDQPPWNGTEGRTCHFWGAEHPSSGTTFGATGWF